MKKSFILFLSMTVALVFNSCSENGIDDNGNGNYKPADYSVKGKVEKGPFVSGSTINLQPMDEKLQPIGSTFSTTITDHLGNFTFGTKTLDAPFAQLTANGYFFNEVKGELSNGTLSLRAVVNVADASTVNVNILTHLKYQRIMNLVENDKKSFSEANTQAQKELMSAFGLDKLSSKEVSNYSIASGTDEAAALIAISSMILEGRSEAQVTEYLAKLSKEFGDNGIFSVDTKEQMKKDMASLLPDLDIIENNVIARYEELNQTVTVKPLESFFDWDGDGIAGNEFLDKDHMPTASQTEISVPKNGGEYTIDINSTVKLYTEKQTLGGYLDEVPGGIVSEETLDIYDKKDEPAVVSSEYKDGKLKINVGQTASRSTTEHVIYLYDLLGNTAITIHLSQEGDISLPLPGLGHDGEMVVLSIAQELANSMYYMTYFVNEYSAPEVIDGRTYVYDYSAPLTPDNRYVSKMWQQFYSAINRIHMLARADKSKLNLFDAQLSVMYALCYYNMVTIWGDVPYTTYEYSYENNPYIARTKESEILSTLSSSLQTAINTLEEKRNESYKSANDLFGASKDVARALLAQIYMYQGKYNDALPLLTKIKNNGFYSLTSSDGKLIQDEETIYGLIHNVSNTRSVASGNNIQVISYPEIMLLLAECEEKAGNESAAQSILQDLASKKNITFTSTDVLHRIKEVRKSFTNMPGFFAYMKRAELAQSELGLQSYQLLFPIPYQELLYNYNLTQNPGYDGRGTRAFSRTRTIIKR